MNPFEQLLLQAGRLGIGFKAPQLTKSAADAVTNPGTYRALAKAAEQTLGRALPTEFRGANFANIPTRATGYLSDVGQMAEGAARNIKAGAVQGILDSMAGRSPRPTSLMQGGTPAARPINPTAFPQQIGAPGPYAQDYGLTRQFVKDVGGKTLTEASEILSAPVGKVGGLFRNLGSDPGLVGGLIQNLNKATSPLLRSSNIVKNIPGIGSLPGFARNMLIPASPAGVAFSVLGLEGSSPQGFDNWHHLGYKSKEDMQNRVNAQITKEGVVAPGRYIPGNQQKPISVNQVNPPPPPVIPPAPKFPPPSTNPIAERAYAAERSSVAQQAAQNPMLQQYQNLRATNPAAVQNLGMQAWAQQYGGPEGLASQVKPGQVGYDVIQQALAGQTASSTSKIPGVVSQPWAEGVVSVGGATRAGLPMTPEEEAQLQYQMFNYRPE